MNLKHWKQNSTRTAMWARTVQQYMHRWTHGPSTQRRIAMFHAGRCGSSVLADMLAQHSEMHWANEIFENMQPSFYRMHSDRRAKARIAATIHPPLAEYFGFETKYLPEQHFRKELANHTPTSYIALLRQFDFSHYILLDRKNHLRRAVSTAIGTKTNQWSSINPDQRVTTVTLDPNNFVSYGETMPLISFFESLQSSYDNMKRAIGDQLLLELNYEDDILSDPTIGYHKACDFIGLSPQPDVVVRLRKQNATPISELLENYDEIVSCLSGTPYEWMLTAA